MMLTSLFGGYLAAYLLWAGIALGCLATALLQYVTGGRWGLAVRRTAEAGARTMPVVAIMFVPLLFGLPVLYAWDRPAEVAASPLLQGKAAYLNLPFFLVRAVLYFACWIGLAWLLDRWSVAEDRADDPGLRVKLRRLGVVGLIVLGFTAAFAMIDWVMSLEPDWYSTVYPSMVATGGWLAAWAFLILVVLRVAPRSDLGPVVTPQVRNDLGSLLLAFLMLWAYQAYSQYLLIWSGNLQEEIPWYLRRLEGGWSWVVLAMAVLGFGVPFFLLIFREIKRSVRWLGGIAAGLLATRLIETIWLVGPGIGGDLWLVLFAVLAAVVLGAIWLWAFARELRVRPLLPRHDPRLAEAIEASTEARHAVA